MTSNANPRLLVAHGADARLAAAGEWLAGLGGLGERLVIAPTRSAADDFLRRFVPGENGLFGLHRLTPLQLAAELATPRLAADARTPLTALGGEALVARCLERCTPELTYFAPVASSPGLPRALRVTLGELRANGISGDALVATSDAAESPGADLARLLAAYQEELETRDLTDTAGILRRAAEVAEGKEVPHRLLGLPTVLLDVSPQSLADRRLLEAIVQRAPQLLATAPSGDRRGIEALEALCGAPAQDVEAHSDDSGTPSRLERLRHRVFQPGQSPELPPPDSDDLSVELLSAPGEGRECVEIARRVLALARKDVPFDSMAILLRDPATYFPLLEEALRRAGVPAYFTRGTARPHPAGRAFLALLACAAEKLSATRFAEYLSLGQVPPADDEGKPPLVEVPWVVPQGEQMVFKSFLFATPEDTTESPETLETHETPVIAGTLRTPRRWERLLVDAAVYGGKERWQRRLKGLKEELRLRLRHLEGEEEGERRRLEAQLSRLETLERFALPLIGDLADLPQTANWGPWLEALEALASRALRQPEQVLEVLSELRPMDRVGPVGIDEVRRVLEERLTTLRSDTPERRYARVFVATPEEARGRSFEAVFLPGLAEGIFPRRAHEDPLLLDVYRQKLDAPLTTQRQRIEDERLLLRIAAGAAEKRLLLTWPNLDVLNGRARVPSFYALDVLRATEGRLPELRQLEEQAAAGSAAILGWPAPRDAETAIDEAEFDLAVLEPLLRRGGAEAKGQGRYLLHTNERLARSLRSRFARWRGRLGPADGLVHPSPGAQAALAPRRLSRRSYSPTALQHFAACPYRFFLSALHRLRPREEASRLEQLDPLTRGSLFHEVQLELFRDLREQNLLPVKEPDLAIVLGLADRHLEQTAARYEEDLAPAIPRVWRSEIETLRTDLRGWLHAVAQRGGNWKPVHFELGFGLSENHHRRPLDEARHEAVVQGGKRLKGAIDLVELDPERQVLRVTDHKTGRPPKAKEVIVGHGEILQPLLYALAAEVHLDRPVEVGRLFYCTRRGGYEERQVPLTDETRRTLGLVLDMIDKAIETGFFPALPREGACQYCDYRLLCGPNEEFRTERKRRHNADAIRGLTALREIP